MILSYYDFLRVRGISLVVRTRRSSLYNVISKYSPAVYNNFVFSISSSGPHFSSIWPGADNFLKCWTKSCAVVVFPSWTSLHWARSRVARAIFPRFRANFAAVRPSSIRWLLIGTVGSEEESKTKKYCKQNDWTNNNCTQLIQIISEQDILHAAISKKIAQLFRVS